MKSKWLIDKYLIENSYHEDISEILNRLGFEVIVEQYIPFDNTPIEKKYSDDDCVVVYGSISYVESRTKDRGFIPGKYYEKEGLECISYMHKIDDFSILANSNHVFTTFKDFINRKDFFYNIFNTNKVFIRPNSGFKTFTGLPIHEEEFNREINSLQQITSVTDDTLILVSSCKKISEEYRFFIVNREVVTGSQYKKNEELFIRKGYSDIAYNTAVKMAKNKWQPDLAYACDVGIINGEAKIIELNCFSSSGFYACDIEKLILAVDKVAVMEYNCEISIGE